MKSHIPTEKELAQKVKLVEVKVRGEYIARIDERRKTSKKYDIVVEAPERFTKSDLKRLTPRALIADDKIQDFVSMRTFDSYGTPKKTNKTMTRRDIYTQRELNRFDKIRREAAKQRRQELIERRTLGDTSDYDENTGLPPVINEGPLHED